ncbi:3-phosphoshikimate 1-carboxyvinyltransferase [Chitinasiproducens palmae]|uniref:3-phosphoshikimate 1-carboxyvinyltransferase n=1 Tax=Chitinasiproducens palmae TaxID=1770053 RepID=A0A1H2PV12_9BURK|nr:3-phosphoshikimate 1-carboxyvinyltransferase [Chitinasiproducens palmae]SDV51095.1 3-phosphoshikimate 1-carboxyvinyltransferase [Chitinasiproducens palmae]
MEQLHLPAAQRAAGLVALPGSKSISNRVLLLAALADGVTEIDNLLESDDTAVMLDALRKLGIDWRRDGNRHVVTGGGGSFATKRADLFVGNAGTAVRPLTAALALADGEYRIDGVARMHERPIGDLVDTLRQLGARIDYRGNDGYPPLTIGARAANRPASVSVRGDVSSQFLTALLLALPNALAAAGETGLAIVVEGELISKPYVEITLDLMQRFGVAVQRDGWQRFDVPAVRYRSPGRVLVEGDASSASYFLAAGAIGGGPVRVSGVGRASVQGDVRFADALLAMGAQCRIDADAIEVSAPSDGRLRAIDLDCNLIPDAAMTLAVVALFAQGRTCLRNIGSWRVKETDRIAALATELRKFGAAVEEGEDWLAVTPPAALTPGVAVDTYDDHRVAMCFSLASLGNVPVTINDPRCVAKTFPDYFDHFAEIVR